MQRFNPSFDFCSQICQRTTGDIEAGQNFDDFGVGHGDFSKLPGLSQDHPGSMVRSTLPRFGAASKCLGGVDVGISGPVTAGQNF